MTSSWSESEKLLLSDLRISLLWFLGNLKVFPGERWTGNGFLYLAKLMANTFLHFWNVFSCVFLAGKSPCCSKLLKFWPATTLTLLICRFWILGCSTGWWPGGSSSVEWQHHKATVTLWTSQGRGCGCWGAENTLRTKKKKVFPPGFGSLTSFPPLALNSLLGVFKLFFHFQVWPWF